jgi:sporulation protein YlmC with PRC-barrel domain
MKKTSKIDRKLSSTLVATLCVAAGLVTAQAQDAPLSGPTQARPQTPEAVSQSQRLVTDKTEACQPTKMNKCSELIGTAVENPQGDKLGKIEEVVVDFDNGRVSYCVMGVEHKLFATPKYLAVPLSALRASADGTHLILNADKDKVAQAQGFDRNNWPSVTSPAWGAQPFWQTAPKMTTTPAPQDQDRNTPPSSATSH